MENNWKTQMKWIYTGENYKARKTEHPTDSF